MRAQKPSGSDIYITPKDKKQNLFFRILAKILFFAEGFAVIDKKHPASTRINDMRRLGIITVIATFLIFVLWSYLAPLESAAIATGNVVLDSNRKTIQHLEGGIISEILVKEGDEVKIGQPLLYLSDTSSGASYKTQLFELKLQEAALARIKAIIEWKDKINFDAQILKDPNPELQRIIENQQNLFRAKKDSIQQKINILNQRILQFRKEINGINSQQASAKEQLALIEEEITSVEQLVAKGLEQKPRLLSLKRKEAELRGNIGEFTSQISKKRDQISESKLTILNLKTEAIEEATKELKEVQLKIGQLKEGVTATGDIVDRTAITAPQSGIITGLKFHTVGGVIPPGQPIMDIVPQDDALVIEARLNLRDIDVVYKGQDASVTLSAYKHRTVPKLDAKVIYVSADRFVEERNNNEYYLVRVQITDEARKKHAKDIDLYPGMPAEVFILTGSRSFFEYLIEPITQSFRRSFRED